MIYDLIQDLRSNKSYIWAILASVKLFCKLFRFGVFILGTCYRPVWKGRAWQQLEPKLCSSGVLACYLPCYPLLFHNSLLFIVCHIFFYRFIIHYFIICHYLPLFDIVSIILFHVSSSSTALHISCPHFLTHTHFSMSGLSGEIDFKYVCLISWQTCIHLSLFGMKALVGTLNLIMPWIISFSSGSNKSLFACVSTIILWLWLREAPRKDFICSNVRTPKILMWVYLKGCLH